MKKMIRLSSALLLLATLLTSCSDDELPTTPAVVVPVETVSKDAPIINGVTTTYEKKITITAVGTELISQRRTILVDKVILVPGDYITEVTVNDEVLPLTCLTTQYRVLTEQFFKVIGKNQAIYDSGTKSYSQEKLKLRVKSHLGGYSTYYLFLWENIATINPNMPLTY